MDKIKVLLCGDELTLGQGQLLETLRKESHVEVVMVDKDSGQLQGMDYDLAIMDEGDQYIGVGRMTENDVNEKGFFTAYVEGITDVMKISKSDVIKNYDGVRFIQPLDNDLDAVVDEPFWMKQQANKQFKRGKC